MYNTIEPRLIALLNDSSLEKRKSPSLSLPPLQRARVSRRPSPLEPETSTNPASQSTNRPSISRQISSTETSTKQDNGTTVVSLSVGARLSGKTSSQSLRKILGDDDYQGDNRTTKKRRKLDSGNDEFVQLPQPAPKKQKTAPQIVPPIIIGLFEPPPNAALFPPIASSSFHDSLGRNSLNTAPLTGPGKTADLGAVTPAPGEAKCTLAENKPKVQQRRKWTEEETSHLLLGVHKYGVGKWKSILKDPEFHFDSRNAVDLKDRFRTCCPNEIRNKLTSGPKQSAHQRKLNTRDGSTPNPAIETSDSTWSSSAADIISCNFGSQEGRVEDIPSIFTTEAQTAQARGARKSRAHRKQIADLKELGINVPFRPSERRERRPFSEEEDNHILQGWERYGQAWTRILSDPDFKLHGRRPTDLRDRFRNRFPEKYADAAPKANLTGPNSESNSKEVVGMQVDHRPMGSKAEYAPIHESSSRQQLPQHQLERSIMSVAPSAHSNNTAGKSVPQYGIQPFKEIVPEASFNIEMPLLWNDHLNSIGEMDIQRFLLDESWPMPGLSVKHKPSFTDIESICAPVPSNSNGVAGPFGYDILDFRES